MAQTGVAQLKPDAGTFFGHPKGLFTLFMVEMWERFSYYGMRALLVPYLVGQVMSGDGAFSGRGWAEDEAMHLYGLYTGLAYLFPLLGGVIADRLIGTHRSMVVGASLITLGHLVLAASGFGALAFSDWGMALFISGLALIVLGTGHFKPCVSVMVGQLYDGPSNRRDGGFSIFYMGINVGAFLSAFVCGTLGEKVGWHAGFGAAAVGMVLGLLTYFRGRPRHLEGIGLAPEGRPRVAPQLFFGQLLAAALMGLLYYLGGLGLVSTLWDGLVTLLSPLVIWGISVLAVAILAVTFVRSQEPADRGKVATVLSFIFFNALFWMGFEQAGSTLNLFARDNTDRMIGTFEMPFTWFQSINPLLIVALAPVFAALWQWLGKRGKNPAQSVKIALGLLLLGAGFVVMTIAGKLAAQGVKVGMWFLTITYVLHTLGELCLSPTGLSFVTRVSPKRWVSFLMGIWFLSSVVANIGGGLVAGTLRRIEQGEINLSFFGFHFGGQGDFFFLFVLTSLGLGGLVLLLTPLFRRLLGD